MGAYIHHPDKTQKPLTMEEKLLNWIDQIQDAELTAVT